ncbi:hypothetical protein SANTM175S_04614 [Streptomyces antimycoticus]
MEICASSVAMGWARRYVQVVRDPLRRRSPGRPPATTVRLFGAVIRKVKRALSAGWSLQGKTRWAALA